MKSTGTNQPAITAPAQARAMPTRLAEPTDVMEVDTTAGAGAELHQGEAFRSSDNVRQDPQGGRAAFNNYGRQNVQGGPVGGFSGYGRQDSQGGRFDSSENGSFGFSGNFRTEPPRGPRRRY